MNLVYPILFENNSYFVIIMTNYFEISLQVWNDQAQKACFSLNNQQKAQAEQFFYLFVQTTNINLIIELISSGSDILLFIVFTYINKNIMLFSKQTKNFQLFTETLASWQLKKFEVIHPKNGPLKSYTTKTIIMTLGNLLKNLYEAQTTSKEITQLLIKMKASHLKLLIFVYFIEAIQTVDSEMGYMRYRSMVYNFQDNIVPMICQNLMPFFYQIQEGVRISELSYLQERLQVSQNDGNNRNIILISEQLSTQTEYFLMALKKIVEFNYNITYTQYQSQEVIDTCLITFPDKVLQKIINSDFLISLFFIIDKITENNDLPLSKHFLEIAIKCLTKMMQSRLTYISEDNKQKYVINGVKGLYHLIMKCQKIGNEKLLEGVLICNKKLFINVQLCYIRKLINKISQIDSSMNKLYQNYLTQLTKLTLFVIRNSVINIDNFLLLEAIELSYKLIISYGYRDEEHLDQQSQMFMNYAKQTILQYLNNLFQPKYIFQTCKILSLAQNKQFINQIFDLYKKVASYNYEFFFNQISNALNLFTYTSHNSIITFSNFIFLLVEIIDHNYLQRNLYLQKAKDKDIIILSSIVKNITIKIKEFISNRKNLSYSPEEISYIDTAIIIFTQTLLLQFVTGFQGLQVIKIKKKLYNYMLYGEAFSYYFQPEDQKSQETIISYMQILLFYLGSPILTAEDEIKALFCLDTIQKIIFKIKWNMKRQSFTKTTIFKYLQSYFQKFFYEFKYSLDIRSRVAKIMVTLTFDDILDEYKFRVNKFLNILHKQELIILLYDLIGVFQGIQTHAICKYFCTRLKKIVNLDVFFKEIFFLASAKNEEKLYKDICKLIKNIILNKGLKLSNCILGYQLFKSLLPYIILLLKEINKNTESNIQVWSESIYEILQMFSGIINSSHINIFVLDYYNKKSDLQPVQLFYSFTVELFKILVSLPENLRMFPKLQEMFFITINHINKEILNYIYSDTQYILCQIYNLMNIKLIQLTNSYIQLTLNGNKVLQDKLLKMFECLRMFYHYFNQKKKLLHKKHQITNLSNYITLSSNSLEGNKQQQLIFYLITFILTTNKNNHSYLRTISKLIYELTFSFKEFIVIAFYKVLHVNQHLNNLENVLRKNQESQQAFLDSFKNFIKEIN